MKFYLDSSVSPSEEPEDALSWHDTEDDARTAAQVAAIKAPGTIFYVHKVISTHVCVYKAEAKVDLSTEVMDGTANQG